MPDYLILKRNTYYAAMTIPKSVRGFFRDAKGRPLTRFKRSLKTRNRATADTLKLPHLLEWRRKIAEAQKGVDSPEAALLREAEELEQARKAARSLIARRPEDREWVQEMEAHYGVGPTIDDDEVHDTYTLPLLQEVAETRGPEAAQSLDERINGLTTFVEHSYEAWLAQCLDAPQTKVQHTAAIKRFIAWAGVLAVVKLKRAKAGEYINHLLQTSGLTRRTVERHASSMSGLWRWYIARGMAAENPWKGHQLSSKKLKRQNKRRMLPDDDVKSLLSTAYGTGIYLQLHPDLVRVALVTGARIEGLCALKRTDVTKEKDGYWFTIEKDKTEAGRRIIPVHEAVAPIIARRLKDRDKYLFKGLIPGGVEKKRSHHVSKAYGRFRKAAGVTGKGRDFHALRNTFIEWMEGHGVPESTVKLIVGHERESMTFGHYSEGTKVDLRAAINRLDYGTKIMELIRRNPCKDDALCASRSSLSAACEMATAKHL